MTANELSAVLTEAIAGRHLLEHPFYVRWTNGEVSRAELGAYAEQYRHIEAALPEALAAIVADLPAGRARDLVGANLADERSVPMAHVALFETFADSVGARAEVSASAATNAVIAGYRDAEFPAASLAAIAAYEVQAAAIASTKADGCCRHYGASRADVAFWDVHAEMESEHSTWSLDALADLDADREVVFSAARTSADAWWAFLDERESAVKR